MTDIIDKLQADLSEGRFLHSLGVAETARDLALRFGCDPEKAYLAGLLHDCATKYSNTEMLALALSEGLCDRDAVIDNPTAEFHAPLGAVVAKNEFGITDGEILNAIALHQTGDVPMTRLEIIVGLADAIEPSRKADKINAIREIAKTDLTRAYLEKCKLYMTNIISAGNPLDPKRVEVYNYILTLKQGFKP
ncbi:MAG: bis(5'-nucleosyl)-tetraphosphatase (symmetrical) YqeK [Clostridia bacterium]|nr:bis(5'-nucleosyl)-tetraphosphatase (symmetrical) YqeK [Clostridia bacterium]